MSDLNDILTRILTTPTGEPVDRALVDEAMQSCKAFVAPLVVLLRHPHPVLTEEETAQAVNRIALALDDPQRLRPLLDPEGVGIYDRFYPAESRVVTPSTEDAIDSFLDTYGNIDAKEEELLRRMIFNPVPDYASTLAATTAVDTGRPRDNQDDRLDAFLDARPANPVTVKSAAEPVTESLASVAPESNSAPAAAPTSSSFQESLARIFIKERNYRGAYQIIRSISLNNPKKSIYFADQLRFLELLIRNQEALNKKNKKKI